MGSTPKVIGPPLLSGLRAAAGRLGISETNCRRLVDSGRLRAVRLGNRVLIPEDELQRFVARLEDEHR
jgi:excisionase family DNA binding protein